MRDERDLSGVCNKVCLEPLYTGKCKEECAKRYRKVFAVTGPASLRPKGEWISVEERLPEIYDKEPDWSVTVLFRTAQGHIYSGYRNIGRPQRSFYDDDWTPPYWLDESENLSFEEDEVTHWMPLPEPPNTEVVHDS